MSASLIRLIGELTVAVSVAILIVATIRRPLRRFGGSRIAYLSWLLVPASQLVVLLPAPSRAFDTTTQTIPQWMLAALPPAMSPNYSGAATNYAAIAAVVWASGSLLMLFLVIRRQRALLKSLGAMTFMPDGTYRTSTVRGPLLLGVWRPRVVLPVNFESLYDTEERALVLAHERAHQDRGDQLVNLVATLGLCLSWFNPLMYWAIGRLRFDQDLACDAAVLADRPTLRRCYANALLRTQLAAQSGWNSLACAWQSAHPLKQRIVLLKRPTPSYARRRSALVLTCALIVSCSYAVWTILPRAVYAQASQTTSAVLNDAIKLLNAGKFEEAQKALAALDLKSLNPVDRSHAEMALFSIALNDKRYDEARDHLEKAVDAGGLTPEEAARVRYQGAQALARVEGK